MQLEDLLIKPLNELTDEELEQRLYLLKSLRISVTSGGSKSKTPKTNKDRQIDDLLKNLTPEMLEALKKLL